MMLFENFSEIHEKCREYGITNYTVNPDGTIDVDGDVYLLYKDLPLANRIFTRIPLKFRDVSGNFNCNNGMLDTLEGAPISVGGDFKCNRNKLTTLEGAPRWVGRDFTCTYNGLTTLEGAPAHVGGNFYCSNNELYTLEGAPESVPLDFYCNNNELYTLEGAPERVGGRFFCWHNNFEQIRRLFPKSDDLVRANKDWDFFAGGNKIHRLRLKEALADHGIKLPEYIIGYEYV